MKKLLLAGVASLAFMTSASAAVIANLGINPTSATGHFSNAVDGLNFTDQYTFQLVGGPQFVTIASATNDYTQASDFIFNFTGQLFRQVGAVAGDGNDIAVAPPVPAVNCPTNPAGCQLLAGSALLNAGNYFLQISGLGGGTAGYGGNLTTASVVPIPGMAVAVPAGALALGWFARRRRRQSDGQPVAA